MTVPITIELDTRDETMESAFARTKAFLTQRLAELVNVSAPGVVCRDLGDEVRALWSDGTIELVDDGELPDMLPTSAADSVEAADHTLLATPGTRHLRLLSRSER